MVFLKTSRNRPWISGWWFGTFFIFPYIGNNHPNWLIFFRGLQTTNQILLDPQSSPMTHDPGRLRRAHGDPHGHWLGLSGRRPLHLWPGTKLGITHLELSMTSWGWPDNLAPIIHKNMKNDPFMDGCSMKNIKHFWLPLWKPRDLLANREDQCHSSYPWVGFFSPWFLPLWFWKYCCKPKKRDIKLVKSPILE